MILKKTHVMSAMTLTAGSVSIALRNAGYDDNVTTAEFRGMSNSGTFIYDCTYPDIDTGREEDCIIYVSFNDKGVMVAEY